MKKIKLTQKAQRAIFKILLVSNYFNILGFSLFGPIYSLYVLQLGLTPLQITTALALYSITLGICTLLAGRWESTERRTFYAIVLGYAMMVGAGAGFLFMHTVLQIYLVQVINALAAAIVTPAWKALYGRCQTVGQESRDWSFFDGGNQLIAAVSMLISGGVVTYYGFPTLIMMLVALQGIGAIYATKILSFSRNTR